MNIFKARLIQAMISPVKLLFIFILLHQSVCSQTVRKSFEHVYQVVQQNPDSAILMVETLSKKANHLSQTEQSQFYLQAAEFYARMGNFQREAENWKKLSAFLPKESDTLYRIYYRMGMAQLNSGQFTAAGKLFQSCERYFRNTHNDAGLVLAYSGIAAVGVSTGAIKNSINYYYRAINLLEKQKDYLELSKMYSNLSIAYFTIGENQKTLEVRKRAFQLAKRSGDEAEIHFGELNLGSSYNKLGKKDSAIYYLGKAENYYEQHFNAQILNAIYNEFGEVYSKSGDNNLAEDYYLRSIALLKSGGFDFALPGTLGNYGHVLFAKGAYQRGIEVCREALPIARKIGYVEGEMVVCDCLYKNFKGAKNADSALVYYERTRELKDSVANVELQKTALRKELETAHTKEKNVIISDATRKINEVLSLRNVLLIGSSLLLIALLILFYSFRQKKKAVVYIQQEKQYLDNLVHNIVHEFRTPLTLIKGPAEELLKTEPNNTLVRLINKNAERMLDLVNQVLDFAKIKAGKLVVKEEVTNISVFLSGLLDLFTPMAERKNITLRYEQQSEIDMVLIDGDKLFKIISNLLSNAIKYSNEHASVTIFGSVRNHRLCFEVRDTGIGIPPEELQHVFKKFYQIDATLTRKEEGTGLGLAFVEELVLLMKGRIRLQSTVGTGTSIYLDFPYNTAHTSPEIPERKEQMPVYEQKASLVESGQAEELPKILIIEDNEDMRLFISLLLREQGYEVVEAINGEEGITMAIELVPDLIISDVMMPQKDGFQVVEALKKHAATDHIPIILLTAKASFDSLISGLQTGADDYIPKPFKSSELLLRINNQISRQLKMQQKYRVSGTMQPVDKEVRHSLIMQLEKLIERENGIQLSVEEVASACAISRSQLHRKIKFLTGLSTTALLTKLRLDLSVQDLQQSDLTISEISYKYGYSDPANFSRLFRKQFGQSPSELRNQPK